MTTGEADDATASSSAAADALLDSQESRSLQNPHARPPSKLDGLPAQDAADALFRSSEILAPMVRASTTPLRTLALARGATLTFTEEIIDRAVRPAVRTVNAELGTVDYRVPLASYSAKVQRRMAADVANPDSRAGSVLLRIDPAVERDRLVYQVGTGEAALALEAATKVVGDVAGIDVNMGCPKKFSVGGGMGSALLGDERRACDIISTLRRNLAKPVSAKIRLLDPDRPRPTLDFVRALVNAGANAVTIHGRIVGDEAHVDARWRTLVDVVRELKRTEAVPINVNGDLYTRADIEEMRRRTGCDGVMLARPALYNVSVFNRGDGADSTGDGADDSGGPDGDISAFQTRNHAGRLGYGSPLLSPRIDVIKEYIARCVRYRTHSKNAKYVVMEMVNNRRTPASRVPFMDVRLEGGQTVNSVSPCRSLDDLVKLFDVRRTFPIPGTGGGGESKVGEDGADAHRYDDRYFTDHDKFRRERSAVAGSGGAIEGGGTAPKRQKVD